jgi:hypothetical protein
MGVALLVNEGLMSGKGRDLEAKCSNEIEE